MRFGKTFALAAATMIAGSIPEASLAQNPEDDARDTAKPADSVSPYGVSYTTGSFTYSVPLFTIGSGGWPNEISVSLDYDSSGGRLPNEPWTVSVNRRVSAQYAEYRTGFEGDPLWEYHEYMINVVLGNGSQTFQLGNYTLDTANFQPVGNDGSSIQFIEGAPGVYGGRYYQRHGQFIVTGRDGTRIEFTGGMDHMYDGPLSISGAPVLTLPNGFRVEYTPIDSFDPNGVTSPKATTNGLLVRQFGNQICAFNAAIVDQSTINSCAGSPLVASFNGPPAQVTSITRPDGSTYNFEYQSYTSSYSYGGAYSSKTRSHLSCVKEPGQSACVVRNVYSPCDGPGFDYYNPEYFGTGSWVLVDSQWTGSRDRVLSQTLGDGRSVTYSYTGTNAPLDAGCRRISSVLMTEPGASTVVQLEKQPGYRTEESVVTSVTDPLQRTQTYQWTGGNTAAGYMQRNHVLGSVVAPDGQKVEYTYDGRGNRIATRLRPRPGSGGTDIVTSAIFPTSCGNSKTCNQPSSVTDARGNTKIFTYSEVHGGLLTAVSPAVDGVSPAVKYDYSQLTPWLKSGSVFVAGDPVWLLSAERSCKSSVLNLATGTCAAGTADQVLTTYEYQDGNSAKGSNLFLVGVAVTADGQTLRTCYGYDTLGRRISETSPAANLASCQ